MYYPKRPSPLTIATAGGVFAVGVGSLTARAIDTFTSLTLIPPFDLIVFILAVVGVVGGGAWNCWLIVRSYKHQIAVLKAANAELRADRDRLDDILEAVKAADAQGEVNGVRLNKLLKMKEQELAVADTQDIPRRLHSINGGGTA